MNTDKAKQPKATHKFIVTCMRNECRQKPYPYLPLKWYVRSLTSGSESPLMSTPSIVNIAQPGSNPAMSAVVLWCMHACCKCSHRNDGHTHTHIHTQELPHFNVSVPPSLKYFFRFIYNCTTWGVLVDANCHLLAPVPKTTNPRLANVRVYVKASKSVGLSYFLSVCVVSICQFLFVDVCLPFYLVFVHSPPLPAQKAPNLSFSFKDTPKYIFSGGNKGTDICASLRPCNMKMTNETWKQVWQHYTWTKIDTQIDTKKST
jgi:hypothetical protein